MNQRRRILFVSAVGAILLLMWLLRPKPSPPPMSRTEEIEPAKSVEPGSTNESVPASRQANALPLPSAGQEHFHQEVENEIAMWQAPVLYFGKVVDENDKPISGAQAAYGANSMNQLREEVYNTGTATTDERGIFKVDGVKGIGLRVEVTHPDYYPYPTNSTGFDKRSVPRKGYFSDSEENAEVFRMHRKGNPVALIKRGGGLHAPLDGTTMDFPLRGKSRKEIVGHLLVQGWKDNLQKGKRSNWEVKISVPDGGILEFADNFAFVAPETGYQSTWQLTCSKEDPNWQSQASRQFFIKLKDHYVRAGAYIDIYHDLYFSMDYVLNPDGSPNLEADPQVYFEPAE